jgi:hypothetical protein
VDAAKFFACQEIAGSVTREGHDVVIGKLHLGFANPPAFAVSGSANCECKKPAAR